MLLKLNAEKKENVGKLYFNDETLYSVTKEIVKKLEAENQMRSSGYLALGLSGNKNCKIAK